MAIHPDIQKIRIIGFYLKIGSFGSLKFSCYYLIKGEYLVRNTTNIRTDGIFYDLKLHVSAFIGHHQVSTIL